MEADDRDESGLSERGSWGVVSSFTVGWHRGMQNTEKKIISSIEDNLPNVQDMARRFHRDAFAFLSANGWVHVRWLRLSLTGCAELKQIRRKGLNRGPMLFLFY